jgi:hypothetical protein
VRSEELTFGTGQLWGRYSIHPILCSVARPIFFFSFVNSWLQTMSISWIWIDCGNACRSEAWYTTTSSSLMWNLLTISLACLIACHVFVEGTPLLPTLFPSSILWISSGLDGSSSRDKCQAPIVWVHSQCNVSSFQTSVQGYKICILYCWNEEYIRIHMTFK